MKLQLSITEKGLKGFDSYIIIWFIDFFFQLNYLLLSHEKVRN